MILFTKYQINNESNIGMENGNKELARRIGTENWNGELERNQNVFHRGRSSRNS